MCVCMPLTPSNVTQEFVRLGYSPIVVKLSAIFTAALVNVNTITTMFHYHILGKMLSFTHGCNIASYHIWFS
jgi:hypothetical protein